MRKSVAYIYRIAIRLIPLAMIIVFIIGTIGPVPAVADPGWYDTDWQYRKKITINSANVSGSSNLIHFPVLISVVDSDLIGKTMSNAYDIIFTAGDEVTRLSHEVESYDNSTGNLTAWVRIPSLSHTTDTEIYMYYDNNGVGNSENVTDVWNNDFQMVQHLAETSGTHYDSTQYNNDGTANITTPGTQNAAGKVDGADKFDGTNDFIQIPDSSSLDTGGNITIEAWIKHTNMANVEHILSHHSAGSRTGYLLNQFTNDKFRVQLGDGGGVWPAISAESTSAYTDPNAWYYVVFTSDGTNWQFYVNGTADGSGATVSIAPTANAFWIGDDVNAPGTRYWEGNIDEVRISSIARNADWIKTSYNNQSSPATFLSFDSEEGAPSTPSVTTSPASLVEEDTATLNGAITSTGGENADTRGFQWDTDASGPPYSSNWTQAGSFGTGAFTDNLTGLTKGELYYYRAIAHNSAGWDYGGEQTFLTKPDEPTGLTAVSHGTSWVYLTWTNGAGFDSTTIRYDASGYPGSPTSGSPGYFGSGTSVNVTGLNPNQTYYFRAWSYATEGGLEQWSDLYSSDYAKTDSGAPVVIGGKVLTVNKAMVLAPWVLIGIAFIIVVVRIIQHVKKRPSVRPRRKDTL